MRMLQQIVSVTALSIKSLPQRSGSSTIIVISIAGVVAVLIGVLTLSSSLLRTMNGASQPDRAIVLMKGGGVEGFSNLDRAFIPAIEAAPGIGKNAAGEALASPEVVVVVAVREQDNSRSEVVVRGATPIAFDVRPEVKLIAGRLPQSGRHELLAGKTATEQYKNMILGNQVTIRGTRWDVVGVFTANGTVRESELMTDAETLLSTYRRNTYSAVTVKLENPAAFAKFKDALTTDPSISVDVSTEAEYYSRQSEFINQLLKTIAYIVGSIMAIGAMSGAVNCMYSAISARGVEIATLRALGFNPSSIVVSVLSEALLLALIGSAVGALLVWLILSGNTFSTQTAGRSVVAQLQISASLVSTGVVWACAIGFLGGLFPAIKAACMPIATALREV